MPSWPTGLWKQNSGASNYIVYFHLLLLKNGAASPLQSPNSKPLQTLTWKNAIAPFLRLCSSLDPCPTVPVSSQQLVWYFQNVRLSHTSLRNFWWIPISAEVRNRDRITQKRFVDDPLVSQNEFHNIHWRPQGFWECFISRNTTTSTERKNNMNWKNSVRQPQFYRQETH